MHVLKIEILNSKAKQGCNINHEAIVHGFPVCFSDVNT
jgi:hypothetical protein